MSLLIDQNLRAAIEQLYADMEEAYDRVARQIGHSCDGCPDNCCDSYFTHYTYVEWAYLWLGLEQLPDDSLQSVVEGARQYEFASQKVLVQGGIPRQMCPLNVNGRCLLYRHRLMVCRTHGVPAAMTRPDGKVLTFPGCFRCQEVTGGRTDDSTPAPVMERTELLQRLVALERRILENKEGMPRIRMTIARMIVAGPPMFKPGK